MSWGKTERSNKQYLKNTLNPNNSITPWIETKTLKHNGKMNKLLQLWLRQLVSPSHRSIHRIRQVTTMSSPSNNAFLGPQSHMSLLPNSISSGSAVFARFTVMTNRQTNRQTDHATYNVCSNSLHLVLHVAMQSNVDVLNSFAQVCYVQCCGDCYVNQLIV